MRKSFGSSNSENRFAGGSTPKGRGTHVLGKILKIGLPEAAHQRDAELIFFAKILKIGLPEAAHQRNAELIFSVKF